MPVRLDYGIAANSKNPDLAFAVLKELYTDADICNLLMYGIEGTHYQVTADGKFQFGFKGFKGALCIHGPAHDREIVFLKYIYAGSIFIGHVGAVKYASHNKERFCYENKKK